MLDSVEYLINLIFGLMTVASVHDPLVSVGSKHQTGRYIVYTLNLIVL